MQKPKWLRFPRIHLSTAVLVVLAAGAMLGVNLRQYPSPVPPINEIDRYGLSLLDPVMGWPVPCYSCKSPATSLWQQINERYVCGGYASVPFPRVVTLGNSPSNHTTPAWQPVYYIRSNVTAPIWVRTKWWIHALTPLGTDVLTALGVMLLVAVANEFRVRRKSRNKSASFAIGIPQSKF